MATMNFSQSGAYLLFNALQAIILDPEVRTKLTPQQYAQATDALARCKAIAHGETSHESNDPFRTPMEAASRVLDERLPAGTAFITIAFEFLEGPEHMALMSNVPADLVYPALRMIGRQAAAREASETPNG